MEVQEIPPVPSPEQTTANAPVALPRVAITYCTQCKWLLRAAYYAQELLSTFSTALGEVSLVPATGGIFTVTIQHASTVNFSTETRVLWDRKAQGGFPETKQLKALVRDVIDPSRDLGHVDRALGRQTLEQRQGNEGDGQGKDGDRPRVRDQGPGRAPDGCEECK